MERQAPIEKISEQIFGRDQAKGIAHLSEILDIKQTYREHGAPICVIVPELDSLTVGTVVSLADPDKISLSMLLDSLSAQAVRHKPHNGLTWEEVQSLFVQAPYLESFPSRQKLAVSKDMRGKRKIRWFRKTGDPGMEPNPAAVYELLLEVAQRQHDSEADSVDLGPLKRLLTGSLNAASNPRKPTRANSVDSVKSIAHSMMGSICWGMKDGQHASEGLGQRTQTAGVPSPLSHSEPGGKIILNASSMQKHSMEAKSTSNWPVMEIITLRFPTPKEREFKISRLLVNAWTTVERRLILPRAQTVIRIETVSKVFGTRKEFIGSLDGSKQQQALAKATSLFSLP